MQIKRYGHILTDEEILEHRRRGGIKSRTPGTPRNKYWAKYRKIQKQLRKQAIEFLGWKCKHCGLVETECLAVYDFHHEDPTQKDASISELFRAMKPWEEIQPEIEKCILLCANCHRKVHYDKEE
jgi:predicted HNH restriction endonuclease